MQLQGLTDQMLLGPSCFLLICHHGFWWPTIYCLIFAHATWSNSIARLSTQTGLQLFIVWPSVVSHNIVEFQGELLFHYQAVDVMHKVFSSEKTELARFFTRIIPPASRADLLETLRTQLSEHFSLEENASLAKHRRENIHLKIPSLKRIYSLDSEEQYSLHRETLTERPCELLCEYWDSDDFSVSQCMLLAREFIPFFMAVLMNLVSQ